MGCGAGFAYVCTKPNNPNNNINPNPGWLDSVERCQGGKCICTLQSDWDDNNRRPIVATPQGPKTVGEVGDLQKRKGWWSWGTVKAKYNDVQCGWGPRDEGGMKDEHPHKCAPLARAHVRHDRAREALARPFPLPNPPRAAGARAS